MRVLQIVDSLDMGGIQTFLLNLNSKIDQSKVAFDYLVFRPHEQVLEKEFIGIGAKVYKLPNWRKGPIKNRIAIRDFYREHSEYQIIHYHAGTLVDIGPLVEAKHAGICFRIMHSHNTHAAGGYYNTALHNIHKKSISTLATHYFACGDLAAKWMYGGTSVEDSVRIINNGIVTERYRYDSSVREKKRRELGLSNKLVIGHIGRFSPEKNQSFLVDVMKTIHDENKNACLIFIGDGPEKSSVMEKVRSNELKNCIQFLGIRKDVEQLLQAMDVFVMPSLFEGFPVVLVEAQAAGLPCIISDSISSEVKINENVVGLSLNESKQNWARAILEHGIRIETTTKLCESGFDIQNTANCLADFYKGLIYGV